jgi:DNA polymerase sigma
MEIKQGSNKLAAEIKAVEEQFTNMITVEVENLRNFVNSQTTEAAAHRDNLQEIYSEKLDKIKDTCAHYFTSYEQHLIYQQDLVKSLEKRQD